MILFVDILIQYNLQQKSPTSQDAPLERILSFFRYKRTIKYIRNKKVLDFGCGIKNWNSEFIGKYPKLIHGLYRSMHPLKKKIISLKFLEI